MRRRISLQSLGQNGHVDFGKKDVSNQSVNVKQNKRKIARKCRGTTTTTEQSEQRTPFMDHSQHTLAIV